MSTAKKVYAMSIRKGTRMRMASRIETEVGQKRLPISPIALYNSAADKGRKTEGQFYDTRA